MTTYSLQKFEDLIEELSLTYTKAGDKNLKSMTGYGKGTATEKGRTLTIELKTVNNRYIEINSRLPKALSAYDSIIRKEIQAQIKRGSVDVFFNYVNLSEDSKAVTIDMPLAAEYVNAAKKLRTEFRLDDDFNVTALIRSPDILKVEYSADDPEILEHLVIKSIKLAVDELDAMRLTEGKTIQDSLLQLIEGILGLLKGVVDRAPLVVSDYKSKLAARITEALKGVELDESKLLNEVAYFADKSDINEEISRLSSHINQFVTALSVQEPQGRKLDFISQEINREINTIGSKSNDIELTNLVVAMKNELEKIKEQIRNIE